jgi:thiamine-phosphate pyrophosphorylase
MIRCYITDRRATAEPILECIERNLRRGVEWIQIREKDLEAGELFQLVSSACQLLNLHGSRILVNTRVDVALAAGAAGAHLPAGSPAPHRWRGITPAGFLIGVSCHTVEEVQLAEEGGADYAVFGPVFAPRSKESDFHPRGLQLLEQAARAVHIPVLALGGIAESNLDACVKRGAAGVAGISLFQNA